VSILLVERDKQMLLHSYDRLGQSALDHSKDKFLVQSCAVSDDFSRQYEEERSANPESAGDNNRGGDMGKSGGLSKGMAERLTSMWNAAGGRGIPIHNKKLHVRHIVSAEAAASGGDSAVGNPPRGSAAASSTPTASSSTSPSTGPPPSAGAGPAAAASRSPPESMSPEQMFHEIATLRRKYDELVSFSVNLTAERDVLNNALEQSKRDLHRETGARVALERRDGGGVAGVGGGASRMIKTSKKGGVSLVIVLILAVVAFLGGIKVGGGGAVPEILGDMPVLGPALGLQKEGEGVEEL